MNRKIENFKSLATTRSQHEGPIFDQSNSGCLSGPTGDNRSSETVMDGLKKNGIDRSDSDGVALGYNFRKLILIQKCNGS